MKTVYEILEILKTKRYETYKDIYNISKVLVDGSLSWIPDEKYSGRLKFKYYQTWVCTDTKVGVGAYYLDDEFVAFSEQPARKSSERIEFASKESALKLKKFLEQFLEADDRFQIVDMKTAVADYSYSILLNDRILYDN